jgi:type IV pilus assembly protein PilE
MTAARRAAGFTLIELMIVVAVIAILAAIALPSYQNSVRKSRRADAKTALLDLAARQERFYTINNAYSNGTTVPNSLGYGLPANLGTGATPDYVLSVGTPNAGSATGPTFSLTAQAQGDQVSDSCGSYTLDNFGNQGNTGGTPPYTGCW